MRKHLYFLLCWLMIVIAAVSFGACDNPNTNAGGGTGGNGGGNGTNTYSIVGTWVRAVVNGNDTTALFTLTLNADNTGSFNGYNANGSFTYNLLYNYEAAADSGKFVMTEPATGKTITRPFRVEWYGASNFILYLRYLDDSGEWENMGLFTLKSGNGGNGGNGGGQQGGGSDAALTPEQAKEKLMSIAQEMINTFQTSDQRDFIEIVDACYSKYENYSWEGFEDYFENKYDPVFDDGQHYAPERPNPVAPYVDMMCRIARVAEGKAAPTNINYVFSFEQDNFIFEADDANKKWNYLGKSSDNSVIVRFKDAQGRSCELKAWREGATKTYTYTWTENGQQHTLGGVLPAKVSVRLTCNGTQRAQGTFTQELQKNNHAYLNFDVKLVNLSWNIDMKINSTHGSFAFDMKYGNKPYVSAAVNLPLYELIGKRDDQSYEDWANQYEERYDELIKKIGAADAIIDILGKMQIKVNTDNVGYAYRDFMNWDSRYTSYGTRESTRAFCSCFNDNNVNGIYFNSDVKQAEVRVSPVYDESCNQYYPEGVLYFPADGTTYGFEEYFVRKPFTDLQYMVEDLINKYIRLSNNLYSEVGTISFDDSGK